MLIVFAPGFNVIFGDVPPFIVTTSYSGGSIVVSLTVTFKVVMSAAVYEVVKELKPGDRLTFCPLAVKESDINCPWALAVLLTLSIAKVNNRKHNTLNGLLIA
jgi:hypothetical protein